MIPRLPFWMVQRQIKAEPVNGDAIRLQAPNLAHHEVSLRQSASGSAWSAALYQLPTEGDKVLVAETESFPNPQAAAEAAFELFRRHVIV